MFWRAWTLIYWPYFTNCTAYSTDKNKQSSSLELSLYFLERLNSWPVIQKCLNYKRKGVVFFQRVPALCYLAFVSGKKSYWWNHIPTALYSKCLHTTKVWMEITVIINYFSISTWQAHENLVYWREGHGCGSTYIVVRLSWKRSI